MRRICFLVDGFNVYHSVRDLERDVAAAKEAADEGGASPNRLALLPDSLHWLDLDALCASYMGSVDSTARGRTVFYFSALAKHSEKRNPGAVARHEKFISALKSTGVVPALGEFKEKDERCRRYRDGSLHCQFGNDLECDGHFKRHEEKQTDVAIASTLVRLAATAEDCAAIVLVGGDSDLLPAIRTAREIRPEIRLVAAFPYQRNSNEVRKAVDLPITIRPEHYAKHQLPDVVISPNGVEIHKPDVW